MNTPDHTTKRCPKCGQDYPLTSEFWHKDKSRKDNFYVNCKTCESHRRKKEREENPEQRKVVTQRYLAKHPDKRKESVDKYIKANRTILNAKKRQWHERNAEIEREKSKARRKKALVENPTKIREQKRIAERRRRVRKANANGNHTKEETKELYLNQRGLCFYCEVELNGKYHEDHWIPLSKGGSDWISNIRLLCPKCNLSKKDKLPHEWSDRYG